MHDVDILVKDIINDIKTNEKDINEYRNKTKLLILSCFDNNRNKTKQSY